MIGNKNYDERLLSNPINEVNTKYPIHYNEDKQIEDPKNISLEEQFLYNSSPISNIDTNIYDDYRNRIEELRTRTESYYEGLESCIVPVPIDGMAIQPKTKIESDGNTEKDKYIKSDTYVFQDHDSGISIERKEYVFKTNKVKFVSDRHRRFIYDRTIHIMPTKEDEANNITFEKMINNYFSKYYKQTYISIMVDIDYNSIEIEDISKKIFSIDQNTMQLYNKDIQLYKSSKDKTILTIEYENGNYKIKGDDEYKTYSYSLSSLVRVIKNMIPISGQDIDTRIPSSIYNLSVLNWIHPSLIFLNGFSMSWVNTLISIDNIDTYVIIAPSDSSVYIKTINDDEDLTMDYIHIPLNMVYIPYNSVPTLNFEEYIQEDNLLPLPMFSIHINTGSMDISDEDEYTLKSTYSLSSKRIDRILCLDPDVIFTDLIIDKDTTEESYISQLGINLNRYDELSKFCNHDYRCKLKQFNFLGFEYKTVDYGNENSSISANVLKLNDYNITWHPFNIMDIKFDNIHNNPRKFKVFYNKKVLYDQDNILRVKNIIPLEKEYVQYRKELNANIETYIKEIHNLARKDIGLYKDKYGFDYIYISPYEIYNLQYSDMDIEQFKKNCPQFLHGGFILYGLYRLLTKEKGKYSNYLIGDLDKDGVITSTDVTILNKNLLNKVPHSRIDNELGDIDGDGIITNNDITLLVRYISKQYGIVGIDQNAYYSEGLSNNLGSIIPDFENPIPVGDIKKDLLKLRFELTYLNNMEEGSTPVDEFIFYYSNKPENTETEKYLNILAEQIFKYDVDNIKDLMKRLNKNSNRYIPENILPSKRDEYFTNDYNADKIYNYASPNIINIPQDEWMLRQNLPEMFKYYLDESQYTISSSHLLDEVFDFTYDDYNSYIDNLKKGSNYIVGYDSDKLESSIKRSTVSITRTGKELRDRLNENLSLQSNPFKKQYTIENIKYVIFPSLKWNHVLFHTPINIEEMESGNYIGLPNGILQATNTDGTTKDVIKIDNVNKTITDLDKNKSITYTKVEFDHIEGILNYYDENNNIVAYLNVDTYITYFGITMSRWYIPTNESMSNNYVMIFKNGLLLDTYDSIDYNEIMFHVKWNPDKDDDEYEFVFFLNANNNVISKTIEDENDMKVIVPDNINSIDKSSTSTVTMNYAVSCNTTLFDPENVTIFTDLMPRVDEMKYEVIPTDYTAYELSYSIKSYKQTITQSNGIRSFISTIKDDYKINGTYRVTKQGGGEYFINFNGNIPQLSDTTVKTDRNITPPFDIFITSKRQFRYKSFTIPGNVLIQTGYEILLGKDFKFCTDESHMMVFRNGKLIPSNSVFLHSIVDTPVDEISITLDVQVSTDDKIEIFYVTNGLHSINSSIINGEIALNDNGERYNIIGDSIDPKTHNNKRYNYIRLQTPMYACSSRESVFVFINGIKVRSNQIEDITSTILSIHDNNIKNAVNLVVLCHLDNQDIIEHIVINDGLNHYKTGDNNSGTLPEAYFKNTFGANIEDINMNDLKNYNYTNTLDKLLNNLNDEQLNKLFYNYDDHTDAPTSISNKNDLENSLFVSRDTIIDKILKSKYIDQDPEWINRFK